MFTKKNTTKNDNSLACYKKRHTFAAQLRNKTTQFSVAQMAESVDALVSNTSGFISIPVRPRVWVQKPL